MPIQAPAPKLEWVRPPLQARSAQTLERLLDAAEQLIGERGIDGTTIAEIAELAQSSVGAFYARFPDKEALLRCVFERFVAQAEATAAKALEPERWRGLPAQAVLRAAVGFAEAIVRERRSLIAAFAARAATDPELNTLASRLSAVIAEHLAALLTERNELVEHPNPARAVEFAVWVLLGVLEASCLHPPAVGPDLDPERIADELARMCARYLGLAPASQRKE